eukprot:242620_1
MCNALYLFIGDMEGEHMSANVFSTCSVSFVLDKYTKNTQFVFYVLPSSFCVVFGFILMTLNCVKIRTLSQKKINNNKLRRFYRRYIGYALNTLVFIGGCTCLGLYRYKYYDKWMESANDWLQCVVDNNERVDLCVHEERDVETIEIISVIVTAVPIVFGGWIIAWTDSNVAFWKETFERRSRSVESVQTDNNE